MEVKPENNYEFEQLCRLIGLEESGDCVQINLGVQEKQFEIAKLAKKLKQRLFILFKTNPTTNDSQSADQLFINLCIHQNKFSFVSSINAHLTEVLLH